MYVPLSLLASLWVLSLSPPSPIPFREVGVAWWGSLTFLFTVSLSTSLLDREAGRRRGRWGQWKKRKRKAYWTLRWEGRVQLQTTDLLKRFQPGRPPLDFLISQLYGLSAAPFTPWLHASPRCWSPGVSQECRAEPCQGPQRLLDRRHPGHREKGEPVG